MPRRPPSPEPAARRRRSRAEPTAAADARAAGQDPIVTELGAWFDRVARDLPWRRTRDAYAIWLSEIMLQQTRVDTVVPYYERFLGRFPDVGALARAELGDVLALWSGLGYYRRARELHATAREVVERYGGRFPDTGEGLRSLRGIGRYTAGAIASIAFARPEPLVDGNVARVFARIYALDLDPKSTAGQRALWALAERLVPSDRPGRFNQALMELGATVCTPREPRCDACPVRARCAAAAQGRQHELPRTSEKRAPRAVEVVAAVVFAPDRVRVLLGRRPAGGLFGGLWEPPMVEADALATARAPLADLGLGGVELRAAGRVKHVLSHRVLGVTVVRGEAARAARPRASSGAYEELAFRDPDDAAIGLSTLARKVLAAARA